MKVFCSKLPLEVKNHDEWFELFEINSSGSVRFHASMPEKALIIQIKDKLSKTPCRKQSRWVIFKHSTTTTTERVVE